MKTGNSTTTIGVDERTTINCLASHFNVSIGESVVGRRCVGPWERSHVGKWSDGRRYYLNLFETIDPTHHKPSEKWCAIHIHRRPTVIPIKCLRRSKIRAESSYRGFWVVVLLQRKTIGVAFMKTKRPIALTCISDIVTLMNADRPHRGYVSVATERYRTKLLFKTFDVWEWGRS